jgi:hypothetical protein
VTILRILLAEKKVYIYTKTVGKHKMIQEA